MPTPNRETGVAKTSASGRRGSLPAPVLVVMVLVVIAAGAVSTWAMYGVARREREQAIAARYQAETERLRAEEERQRAEAVSAFLAESLAQVDPVNKSRPGETAVREVLDQAAAGVGEKFADEPLVEARLRATLGRAYAEQSLFAEAEENLLRAHELLSATPETADDERAAVAASLVELYKQWHAGEPTRGFDEKAAEWRVKAPRKGP